MSDLYEYTDKRRLEVLDGLSYEERDEVCDSHAHCCDCPMALFYKVYFENRSDEKIYCVDTTSRRKVLKMLSSGGYFKGRKVEKT